MIDLPDRKQYDVPYNSGNIKEKHLVFFHLSPLHIFLVFVKRGKIKQVWLPGQGGLERKQGLYLTSV